MKNLLIDERIEKFPVDAQIKGYLPVITYRTRRALERNGVNTMGQLICLYERELLKLNGIGRKSLNEIKEGLSSVGVSLGSFRKEPRLMKPKTLAAEIITCLEKEGVEYRDLVNALGIAYFTVIEKEMKNADNT